MATFIVATLTSPLNPPGIQYLCAQDEKLLAALLAQLANMVSLTIATCSSKRLFVNIRQEVRYANQPTEATFSAT